MILTHLNAPTQTELLYPSKLSPLISLCPWIQKENHVSALHKPNEPWQFFHILMVPSSLPVAYSLPSGEKLMLHIGP